MDKTKMHEEGHEKAPPVTIVEKQEAPEKKDGPQVAGKAGPAAGAQAPVVIMPVSERREGSAEQARKMAAMQRSVGNTRLARMLAGRAHTDEHDEKEDEGHKPIAPVQLEQEKGKGRV